MRSRHRARHSLAPAGLGQGTRKAALNRDPGAIAEKIGYGQAKRLATELLRCGNIDRPGGRVGIDRLRIGRRRAHFLPALPLRRTRHVAIEARHTGDDDVFAIHLEYMVAHAAVNRPAQDIDAFHEFCSYEA